MDQQIPKLVLDFQLESNGGASRRRVTHVVHDPRLPPTAKPALETWESARRAIGRGGQGEVFLQTCTSGGGRHDNVRALKVVRCVDGDARRRYIRELETMVRFSHERYSKSFVRMLGWYISRGNGDLCIALEYLAHGDIYTFIQDRHPLDEPDAKQVISQVLHGLDHMHMAGFAHMDIKPQNILIQQLPTPDDPEAWWVKLADFGISRNLDATNSVIGLGTPDYMAPELFGLSIKAFDIDLRLADVWAVGVTAFYLLTKEKGFRDWRIHSHTEDVGAAGPARLGRGDREVSADGVLFVLKSTMDNPTERLRWEVASDHAWVAPYRPALVQIAEEDEDNGSSIASWSPTSPTDATEELVKGLTTIETVLSEPNPGSSPTTAVLDNDARGVESSNPPGQTGGSGQEQAAGQLEDGVKGLDLMGDAGWSDIDKGLEEAIVIKDPRLANDSTQKEHDKKKRTDLDRRDDSTQREQKVDVASPDDMLKSMEMTLGIKINLDRPDGAFNELGQTALFAAAHGGHLDMTTTLIEHGAYMEQTHEGATPLWAAAEQGHVDVVAYLARAGADVSVRGPDGCRPLSAAAGAGHSAVVRLLVELGAELDDRDDRRATAMHEAAVQGHADVIKLLADAGAVVSAVDEDGLTPLHEAVQGDHRDAVEALLLHVTEINDRGGCGQTALWMACLRGRVEMPRLLLHAGANPDVLNLDGSTTLHMAAEAGHVDLIRLLLRHGAHINRPGWDHDTPLHCAARAMRHDALRVLVELGADVEAPGALGRTPLVAAVCAGRTETIRLLVALGVDVDARDGVGRTPLFHAGTEDMIDLLMSFGADVEARDYDGQTALFWAAHRPDTNIHLLRHLVRHAGADIDARDFAGLTPLFHAVMARRPSSVTALASLGTDLGARDGGGATPLHTAVSHQFADIVKALISHGCSVLLTDDQGRTALDVARELGRWDIASTIRQVADRALVKRIEG